MTKMEEKKMVENSERKGVTKMTYGQRLQMMKKGVADTKEAEALNDLLFYAYNAGREDAAREVCDKADEYFDEQIRRAMNCRYYKMAMKIVDVVPDWQRVPDGSKKYFVHSGDYAGDYQGTCCATEWNGD